jgi:hypothetical protein
MPFITPRMITPIRTNVSISFWTLAPVTAAAAIEEEEEEEDEGDEVMTVDAKTKAKDVGDIAYNHLSEAPASWDATC